MKNFPYQFINRVRRDARRRREPVTLQTVGRTSTFVAYDWGNDTFIFERDIWKHRPPRAPVLIVPKNQLAPCLEGYVMTVTAGNHVVAAVPLLRGDFWNLGRVPKRQYNEVLLRGMVYGNLVGNTLEISQRDVLAWRVYDVDEWLRGLGWPLSGVVIADRVDATLEYYRRMGQEWRIKPLAWTRDEMDLAIRSSRARIHSRLNYYHSVKGVHLLSYREFSRMAAWAREDYEAFLTALTEIVGTDGELRDSLMRIPKYHGHHEIELFGVHGSRAIDSLVPELERLHGEIEQGRCQQDEAIRRIEWIQRRFYQLLENPELADEEHDMFAGSIYKHLTGEVYYGNSGQVIPAFDDRKTALPGATYRGGKPEIHPGADKRTLAILDYVQSMLSHGECIEYVNVYELRLENHTPLGRGPTREIVFKTNRRPVCMRLIEKRLAHHGTGYANYMLARVQGLQSLGVAYGNHYLLARHDRQAGEVHYYIRERYPGNAFGSIARNQFQKTDPVRGMVYDPPPILMVAALMGRAAAQTLAVKKYIPESRSVHFGEGKEIIEFGFDVQLMREMPLRVRLCSVRGTLGWPRLERTEENLLQCFELYLQSFAVAMIGFWREYADAVKLSQVRNHFLDGFAAATRELHWSYISRREQFDLFDPDVRSKFRFKAKWLFALWSLIQQQERLPWLRSRFNEIMDLRAETHPRVDSETGGAS